MVCCRQVAVQSVTVCCVRPFWMTDIAYTLYCTGAFARYSVTKVDKTTQQCLVCIHTYWACTFHHSGIQKTLALGHPSWVAIGRITGVAGGGYVMY